MVSSEAKEVDTAEGFDGGWEEAAAVSPPAARSRSVPEENDAFFLTPLCVCCVCAAAAHVGPHAVNDICGSTVRQIACSP